MWYNPLMKWLLRSPLHGMVSKGVMLVTYTGRKSGKVYSTPVNYIRAGDLLLTTSFKGRTWWRSLRGGALVTVRLQGKDLPAAAEVVEEGQGVVENLAEIMRQAPQYARYLGVRLDGDQEADLDDVRRAAQERVVVRTRLV